MKKLVVFFALPYFILISCGKIQEPEFKRITGLGIKKISLPDIMIGFKAIYVNPNNFGVTVKEAAFDIYMDSIYIGKLNQPEPITVNKKTEFAIPLEGAIALKTAIALDIKNLINKVVLIKADGSVKIGKAGVFITKQIHYQGKHQVDREALKTLPAQLD